MKSLQCGMKSSCNLHLEDTAGLATLHFSAGQTFEIVDVRKHDDAWYATNTEYPTLWFPLSSTHWKSDSDAKAKGGKAEEDDDLLPSLSFLPSGKGSIKYKDSSCYEGDWEEGERHGKGVFTWPQGESGSDKCTRYRGEWKNGKLSGQGILEWQSGAKFVGTFHASCPVKGVLEMPGPLSCCLTFNCKGAVECLQGHAMKMQESFYAWTCDVCNKSKTGSTRMRCAPCDYDICSNCHKAMTATLHNMLENPQLPQHHTRRDIGGLSAALWMAIQNGASESYKRHVRSLDLDVQDRILVKQLHVAENAASPGPRRRRDALKIKYQIGDNAVEQILKAFSSEDAASKIQWTMEVEAMGPPKSISSACTAGGCTSLGRSTMAAQSLRRQDLASMTVVRLRQQLSACGLKTSGKKSCLVARLGAHMQVQSGGVDDADGGMMEEPALGPDDAAGDDVEDEIQRMLNTAAAGLAELEKAGSFIFCLTPARSLQPDPLASMKMDALRPLYVAAGRLVGCALWTGKTLSVPLARFFCRRVLEVTQLSLSARFASCRCILRSAVWCDTGCSGRWCQQSACSSIPQTATGLPSMVL